MHELINPFTALLGKLQARRALKKKNRSLKASHHVVSAGVDVAMEDVGNADPASVAEVEDTLRTQLQAICAAAAAKHHTPSPAADPLAAPVPPADRLAALSSDLQATARRLRALRARQLAATIPWLPDLPDAALHLVLTHSGPATRRVCRRFRQLHSGPPAAVRPCPLDAAPAAAPLLALACLPTARTLDLRQYPEAEPSTSAAAIARCAALQEVFLPQPAHPAEFSALLAHAPTLRDFSPLSIKSGARYPTSEDLTGGLPRFTALQSLHVYEWHSPAPLACLTALTALTKLSFQMLACMGSSENSMGELLATAAQLPLLRDLRLPTYNIAWDTAAAQLLRGFTRLASLHVGTGQVHPPEEIRAAMVDAIAALTSLTNLMLVEPIRWTTASALSALRPLPLQALGVGMYCEYGPDMVTNEERGEMVAVLACRTTLTSLYIERAPLDVAAPLAEPEVQEWAAKVAPAGNGSAAYGSWPGGAPAAAPTCMDVALAALRGSLLSLDLKHCVVPAGLFASLAAVGGLRCLQVNYCWCRDVPRPDTEELPLSYDGLGRLTRLTSLMLCSSAPFEAPLQELTSLAALRELSLPQWRQQAAELWALVPLRELQALTVCQTFEDGDDEGDDEGRQAACAVLQHCASLRRVAVMGVKGNALKSQCLFQDDIVQLAQGGC